MIRYITILALCFLLNPYSHSQIPAKPVTGPPLNLHSAWVDSVYKSLSLDERIAQLIMIPAYSGKGKENLQTVRTAIKNQKVGGVIFFQGGPVRQATLTNMFQKETKTPLLVAIDGEWGLYMRLDSVPRLPRQMLLGAIRNDTIIRDMGRFVGDQCRRIGIHINFAPSVDVNNNPLNPVIGTRSFGEDPGQVAKSAIAYMLGMQEKGLITSAKHFPGHGDTETDSHHAMPVINKSREELEKMELMPFKAMIKAGASGIMAGHLCIPALDTTKNRPASLSRPILTGLLRNEMQFKGLLFTDALNMKGSSDNFKSGELEVNAFIAGNDMLVMPTNVPLAIKAIKEAILSGRADSLQLEESCRRILAAKEMAGLNKPTPVIIKNIITDLNSAEARVLQRKIMENAVTVLNNKDSIIPVKNLDKTRIAVVLAGTTVRNDFVRRLGDYARADVFFVSKSSEQNNQLLKKLENYDLVIGGIHNTSSTPANNYGVPKSTLDFFDNLATNQNVILALFGVPYILTNSNTISYKAIIIGYEDSSISRDCVAQVIFGGIGAKGRLPVSINSELCAGTGEYTEGGIRFSYTVPESVGIDSVKLIAIDSIINDAIKREAFPGCQVLAALNGKVFFNKSYGKTMYKSGIPVNDSTIYDLASVTKIASGIPAAMRLYDEGKITLDEPISKWLPELKSTNKENLTLRNVLTHQAGLQAFIPFYQKTIKPVESGQTLFSRNKTDTHSIQIANNMYANSKLQYEDGWYADKRTDDYPFCVAQNLYINKNNRDSLFRIIDESTISPNPRYLYSDLGFYYVMRIAEKLTETNLDKFVCSEFYESMGAYNLMYNPLSTIAADNIAPTSDDLIFRKQLIQGHVHDEGAAMMGGVSGHAGLFGNANDLAKIVQLFLNRGYYGGKSYVKPSTVTLFTSCQFCRINGNRRGLGFDKPEPNTKKAGPLPADIVSLSSYGHSGFTGTFVWADPETGLLYIFLSNRVHPDSNNNRLGQLSVRAKILEILSGEARNVAINLSPAPNKYP